MQKATFCKTMMTNENVLIPLPGTCKCLFHQDVPFQLLGWAQTSIFRSIRWTYAFCPPTREFSAFKNLQCKSVIWSAAPLSSPARPQSSPWWTSFHDHPLIKTLLKFLVQSFLFVSVLHQWWTGWSEPTLSSSSMARRRASVFHRRRGPYIAL